MLEDLKIYIAQHKLIEKDDRVLVAVSGGIDSICLATLLLQLKVPIGIAHVNHGTRGQASDDDESFCREFANQHELPFYILRLDKHKIAGNFQAGARDIRYKWFDAIGVEHQFSRIATAHHKDDQVENFFLKLNRGAGLSGCAGMKPKNGKIIRPLLFAGKNDLIAFANEHQIQYREDASNFSDVYDRNFIRNQVIPLLESRFPHFGNQVISFMEKAGQANQIIQLFASEFFENNTVVEKDQLTLSLQQFPDIESGPYLLYEILKPFGANPTQAADVLKANTGSEIHTMTHSILKDRMTLIIRKNSPIQSSATQVVEAEKAVPLTSEFYFMLSNKPKVDALEEIALSTKQMKWPLKIRGRKPGDEFFPAGMGMKKKKLKKYLIDLKLNKYEKERVLLLTDASDRIIWVIGKRQDERFIPGVGDSEIWYASIHRAKK